MQKSGEVISVDIREDERGNSRGFAVVEFNTPNDCFKAIKDLDGTRLDGRMIVVREDEDPNYKKREQRGEQPAASTALDVKKRSRSKSVDKEFASERQIYIGNMPYSVNKA
jgi:RNA recognition motif-containing protein